MLQFTVKETYFATFLSGQLFAVAAEGKQLIRDSKPTDWITGAAVVNAFYMPDYNSISKQKLTEMNVREELGIALFVVLYFRRFE